MSTMEKNRKINKKEAPPDPIYTFKGNHLQVHSLAFLLNSIEEKILVGARDGRVHVWDFETRRKVYELTSGKSGSCISILTTTTGDLITHTRGEAIVLWSRENNGTWSISNSLNAPGNEYCGAQLMDFASNTTPAVLYPAGDRSNLLVANPYENKVLFEIPVDKNLGNVMEVRSAGPDILMALFETGNIMVWDIKNTKKPLSSLNLAMNEKDGFAAMCLAFDNVNKRGVTGNSNKSLAVFNIENDCTLNALSSINITNPGTAALTFRADCKLLACAGWDSRLRLFKWKSSKVSEPLLQPLAVLESHTGGKSLQCVAFSPSPVHAWDSKCLLATAGEDQTVVMWDIYN